MVIFIALKGPHGNIFHLNKSLNAHTTVWSAFSGRSSSTSQENYVQDVQDAWPVWSLSHGFTVAFLNINGVDSIYYFQRPALVCTVFLHGKIKRTKRPCAYYSNSSATFHCTLEGDLVFKLNPGPVNNSHCTQRRHASIDRRVLQSRRNPSNLIDVNNLSRGIPVISYRINDLPIRSPRCRNINNLRPVSRQPSEDRNTLRFCTINARSLNNKAGDFIDFICDYKPDIASITETWFHENESAARVLCTPAGYNLLDYSRTGRLGGGTGIMFREDISVSQNAAGEFQSFEYSEWNITSRSHHFRLIIIYRPPYSDAHPITTGVFLAEFSDYLEHAVLCTDQLLICGDFNIHVDVSDDLDACRFLELLDSVGLDQHVSVPTHISGHTLDLIITRNSDQLLVSSPWTDYLFSDHLPVHCNIQVEKPLLKSKRMSFRKLKSLCEMTCQGQTYAATPSTLLS